MEAECSKNAVGCPHCHRCCSFQGPICIYWSIEWVHWWLCSGIHTTRSYTLGIHEAQYRCLPYRKGHFSHCIWYCRRYCGSGNYRRANGEAVCILTSWNWCFSLFCVACLYFIHERFNRDYFSKLDYKYLHKTENLFSVTGRCITQGLWRGRNLGGGGTKANPKIIWKKKKIKKKK